MAEVITGYVTLGGLILIFAKNLAKKAERQVMSMKTLLIKRKFSLYII